MEATSRKLHVKWDAKDIQEVSSEQLLRHFAFFGNLINFHRIYDKKRKQNVPFCTIIFSKLEEAQSCLDAAEHKLKMGAVLKMQSTGYKDGEEEMCEIMRCQNTSVEAEDSGDAMILEEEEHENNEDAIGDEFMKGYMEKENARKELEKLTHKRMELNYSLENAKRELKKRMEQNYSQTKEPTKEDGMRGNMEEDYRRNRREPNYSEMTEPIGEKTEMEVDVNLGPPTGFPNMPVEHHVHPIPQPIFDATGAGHSASALDILDDGYTADTYSARAPARAGYIANPNGKNRIEGFNFKTKDRRNGEKKSDAITIYTMKAITRKVLVKWDAINYPNVQDNLLMEHLCTFGDLCDFDRPNYKKQTQAKVAFCSIIYSITEQAQACLDAKKHELRDGTILEVQPSKYQDNEDEEMVDILHPQIIPDFATPQIATSQIAVPLIAAPQIAAPEPEVEKDKEMEENMKEAEKKEALTRKLHVKWNEKNLREVKDEHLLKHLAFFGDLIQFDRRFDRRGRKKVPFCTVIFSKLEEAQSCLDHGVHKLKRGAVLKMESHASYTDDEESMSEIIRNQNTSVEEDSVDEMSDEEEENERDKKDDVKREDMEEKIESNRSEGICSNMMEQREEEKMDDDDITKVMEIDRSIPVVTEKRKESRSLEDMRQKWERSKEERESQEREKREENLFGMTLDEFIKGKDKAKALAGGYTEEEYREFLDTNKKVFISWDRFNSPIVGCDELKRFFSKLGGIQKYYRNFNATRKGRRNDKKYEGITYCSITFKKLSEANDCVYHSPHILPGGAVAKAQKSSSKEEIFKYQLFKNGAADRYSDDDDQVYKSGATLWKSREENGESWQVRRAQGRTKWKNEHERRAYRIRGLEKIPGPPPTGPLSNGKKKKKPPPHGPPPHGHPPDFSNFPVEHHVHTIPHPTFAAGYDVGAGHRASALDILDAGSTLDPYSAGARAGYVKGPAAVATIPFAKNRHDADPFEEELDSQASLYAAGFKDAMRKMREKFASTARMMPY